MLYESTGQSLSSFAINERIAAAQISGIGALSDVQLKYFDWDKETYQKIAVEEQVEVASLLSDVALSPDGTPTLNLHIVVGRRDGTALAGHLDKAHVRPTLETILTESPVHLRKVYDPDSGLALIRERHLGADDHRSFLDRIPVSPVPRCHRSY
jgi:uncharacterized protein